MPEITMPQFSESAVEGKLLWWCVREGDHVTAGQVIAEVETDKANIEIEVLSDGVISALKARPGDTVPAGGVLAVLLAEGEVAAPTVAEVPSPQVEPVAPPAPPTPAAVAQPTTAVPVATAIASAPGIVNASPLAARLAQAHGIDLSRVQGTGPGGRIMKEDVLAYRAGYPTEPHEQGAPQAGQSALSAPPTTEPSPATAGRTPPFASASLSPAGPWAASESATATKSLDAQRAGIVWEGVAEEDPEPPAAPPPVSAADLFPRLAMASSQQAESSSSASALVDVSGLFNSRAVLRSRLGRGPWTADGGRLLLPVFVKAVALSLDRCPLAPTTPGDEAHRLRVGVPADDDLLFPLLRATGEMALSDVVSWYRDEAAAPAPAPPTGDMCSEVAVVYVGDSGLESFSGFVTDSCCATLSLGRFVEEPNPPKGHYGGARMMMSATLTVRQPLVEASLAIRFLRQFKQIVEHPVLLTGI